MDSETFLAFHQSGLGRVLGINFAHAEPSKVIAEVEINRTLCSAPDVVHGGAIMTLADCASAYGAVLNRPEGHTTATIESKTNFLKKGNGPLLRAISKPLHVGRTMSVWRAEIYRGENQVAEVTQTQIYVKDRNPEKLSWLKEDRISEAPSMSRFDAKDLPQAKRTEISKNFSAPVVDERWRQIFEGACEVIAEKGFAKASIREIAAASGMPIATMYQYLDRKEDLLTRIYDYFMTDIVFEMGRGSDIGATARERLEHVVRTMIDCFDRRHKYIKLMFQETRSLTPEARERVFELDAQYIAHIQELVQEAAEELPGSSLDAELAANFIYFLSVIWPLRYWAIGKFGRDAVADGIVNMIFNGIGAQAAKVPA